MLRGCLSGKKWVGGQGTPEVHQWSAPLLWELWIGVSLDCPPPLLRIPVDLHISTIYIHTHAHLDLIV